MIFTKAPGCQDPVTVLIGLEVLGTLSSNALLISFVRDMTDIYLSRIIKVGFIGRYLILLL